MPAKSLDPAVRRRDKPVAREAATLPKCPTGIAGLDEITFGGLPRDRPTLVAGGPGCGKTLLALEFLVRGALNYREPGVFFSFEEPERDLVANVRSLGFDLADLERRKLLLVDHLQIERSEIQVTGEYDLEGLFIRLGQAIKAIGAKRVVLDSVESLFSGLPDHVILRSELRRLFHWLKDQGVTTIITGESGERTITREGFEEYVSDCVILLEHRVVGEITTRSMRIVKYRGSRHGTNEYPFVIGETGISVLPVTSLGLRSVASIERVSSGIRGFDAILGGGYYRGTTVLVTGTAGCGESIVAAQFVDAACRRGERAIYFAFEESESQIIRNMRSTGIDLERWTRKGLLRIEVAYPSLYGLETHLALIQRAVEAWSPLAVVFDPASSMAGIGTAAQVRSTLMRLIDHLKSKGITTLLTVLATGDGSGMTTESTVIDLNSKVDTWLLLRDVESNGERNRLLFIVKSRGSAHSNQVTEFHLTDHGIELRAPYLGPGGVLTGSARLTQEARDSAAVLKSKQEVETVSLDLEQRRTVMEAQVLALQGEFERSRIASQRTIEVGSATAAELVKGRVDLGATRGRTATDRRVVGRRKTR